MFDDDDLRDEVEAEFANLQEARENQSLGLFGASNPGFRIFCPDPLKTAEEKVHRRRSDARNKRARHARDIRARLLAGERPNLNRRGPKPQVWFKIAKELGIDLLSPAEPVRGDELGLTELRLLGGTFGRRFRRCPRAFCARRPAGALGLRRGHG